LKKLQCRNPKDARYLVEVRTSEQGNQAVTVFRVVTVGAREKHVKAAEFMGKYLPVVALDSSGFYVVARSAKSVLKIVADSDLFGSSEKSTLRGKVSFNDKLASLILHSDSAVSASSEAPLKRSADLVCQVLK